MKGVVVGKWFFLVCIWYIHVWHLILFSAQIIHHIYCSSMLHELLSHHMIQNMREIITWIKAGCKVWPQPVIFPVYIKSLAIIVLWVWFLSWTCVLVGKLYFTSSLHLFSVLAVNASTSSCCCGWDLGTIQLDGCQSMVGYRCCSKWGQIHCWHVFFLGH